jgi:serine kinase of HPr protein (carbohydrate metabolism regulator)
MNQTTPITGPRLSAETLHATAIASDGRAVLITGPSGSGKSDLALRLFDRGYSLVSDDQTIVKRSGTQLIASAPTTIAGKFEVRGIGIVDIEAVADVPIALIVELTSEIRRMPDDSPSRVILGVDVPLVTIDASTASAPAKVALALDRLGLKF